MLKNVGSVAIGTSLIALGCYLINPPLLLIYVGSVLAIYGLLSEI